MKSLYLERQQATLLRKKGLSYNEILEKVSVSKSTLSAWLMEMPLTEREKAVLKRRLNSNISLGRIRAAATLRSRKVARYENLRVTAQAEFISFRTDPFFYVGLGLYWAEGGKRNDLFAFTNSDTDMMSVMLAWIERFFHVSRTEVRARLYIHKPYAHENCEAHWSETIKVPISNFRKTIYKPTSLLVKKRPNYMGCLRIEIGGVSYLRKYVFWQQMMLEDYAKQGYC